MYLSMDIIITIIILLFVEGTYYMLLLLFITSVTVHLLPKSATNYSSCLERSMPENIFVV